MKYFFSIILILLLSINIFAQEEATETIIEVTGTIIDASTKEPIQHVHLINSQKFYATVSDTSGYFRILMTATNSIRISCIGYEVKYWEFDDQTFTDSTYNTDIYLEPKIYELSNVDIYNMRWKSFTYEISHTKVDRDEKQEQLQIWFDNMVSENDLKGVYIASRGVGFVIPFKTKQEKQLLKLRKLKKQTELNEKAYQKYNKEFVHSITKLEGQELDDFMTFCRFERSFILKTSEYNLIIIISEIFDIYKEEKM